MLVLRIRDFSFLLPLEIQREIVARIEIERAIVHGNLELIKLYEEKPARELPEPVSPVSH